MARGWLRRSVLCSPVVAAAGPLSRANAGGVLCAAAAPQDGEDVSTAGLAGWALGDGSYTMGGILVENVQDHVGKTMLINDKSKRVHTHLGMFYENH